MPYFLTQAAYSSEAWSTLMRDPHDRLEALRLAVEKLGGRIVNAFFAFGEYDVVMILEMPDEASAAAAKSYSTGNLKQVFTNEGRAINWFDTKQGEGRWFLDHPTSLKIT